jgi:hypothetical protein
MIIKHGCVLLAENYCLAKCNKEANVLQFYLLQMSVCQFSSPVFKPNGLEQAEHTIHTNLFRLMHTRGMLHSWTNQYVYITYKIKKVLI